MVSEFDRDEQCSSCGRTIPDGEELTYKGRYYCDKCFDRIIRHNNLYSE